MLKTYKNPISQNQFLSFFLSNWINDLICLIKTEWTVATTLDNQTICILQNVDDKILLFDPVAHTSCHKEWFSINWSKTEISFWNIFSHV